MIAQLALRVEEAFADPAGRMVGPAPQHANHTKTEAFDII